MQLLTKLSDPNCMPTRANPRDAGLDLRSSISTIIQPNQSELIDTGVAFKIPMYHVGLVFARSGMAKHNVSPANCVGVIDSDYRGNIKIMLHNYGTEPYEIKQYDRIGQLLVTAVALPNIIHMDWTDSIWYDTDRGINGFGSTGKQ